MKYLALVWIMLLLGACSKAVFVPENSFVLRVHELTTHGLDALHHGRFVSAESSLQRALRSAWLSADPLWIGRAQYYLGALYLALADADKASQLLVKAHANATVAHDKATTWRSAYALALLQQQESGEVVVAIPPLQITMPADVYLSAARLAHLQGRFADAKQAYLHVQALPVDNNEAVYAQGQSLLGLALLAKDEKDVAQAWARSEQLLKLSQQAGLPVLAAHALLLQGKLHQDSDKYERAWAMYQALEDYTGQKDALDALLALSTEQVDKQRWQGALKQLGQEDEQ